MTYKQVEKLNKVRKELRSCMMSDMKKYGTVSSKMLKAMEKLPADDLAKFLKRNPDTLLDVGGGVAAKLGEQAKVVAGELFRELKKDLKTAGVKGAKKAGELRLKLQARGVDYLKKFSAKKEGK